MDDQAINLEGTLFCGQTFAWQKIGTTYQAVLQNRLVSLTCDSFNALVAENESLRHYFDMDWEYEKAETYLSNLDPYLSTCIASYKGLHILNQDPWEVLVSFLLSQNNNIKRIRSLYESLSRHYGTSLDSVWYSFPVPSQMKHVTEAELRSLSLGFRAPYLLDALQQHHLLEEVANQDFDEAKQTLMRIKGVGEKVASCILLFGYHHMHAFPIDTWMKKVMEQRYPGRSPSFFAPYEALAQQYLFHAERMKGVNYKQ